jgi:hypothetical protein
VKLKQYEDQITLMREDIFRLQETEKNIEKIESDMEHMPVVTYESPKKKLTSPYTDDSLASPNLQMTPDSKISNSPPMIMESSKIISNETTIPLKSSCHINWINHPLIASVSSVLASNIKILYHDLTVMEHHYTG